MKTAPPMSGPQWDRKRREYNKMIALYSYHHDIEKNGVCYTMEELHKATFTPLPFDLLILDRIQGGSYEEKKEKIRNNAMHYSHIRMNVNNMSWLDVATISEYFSKYGKRYGLTKEFKKKGII